MVNSSNFRPAHVPRRTLIARLLRMTDDAIVQIGSNRVYGNGTAIDVGLDGPKGEPVSSELGRALRAE